MTKRVPWWSEDSAAWLYSGAMGKIDCWYGEKWVSIDLSQESPSRKILGKHYDTAPADLRRIVEERAAVNNITIDKLREDHMARKLFNGLEITTWLETFEQRQHAFQEGLFSL